MGFFHHKHNDNSIESMKHSNHFHLPHLSHRHHRHDDDASTASAGSNKSHHNHTSRWSRENVKRRYTLTDVVGRGSFGTVRKARLRHSHSHHHGKADPAGNDHQFRDSCRGCKTIPKSKFESKEELEMLKEEVANLELVRGLPHILQFEGAYEDRKNVHIVTELLEGGELFYKIHEMRRAGKYFENEDAAWMVRNILEGLSYCHEVAGIVHRDLKASNFMFVRSSEGRDVRDIKIIDFGLAGRIDPATGEVTGTCGTPYYTAPEVLTNESYTAKVDVWSAGVVTYLILSGSLPYKGKDEIETVRMLQDAENHPPTYESVRWKNRPNVEPEAIDFCNTLMRTDPASRPTAREAMSHPWIVKHCGAPPPPPSPAPSMKRLQLSRDSQQQQHCGLPAATTKGIKNESLHDSISTCSTSSFDEDSSTASHHLSDSSTDLSDDESCPVRMKEQCSIRTEEHQHCVSEMKHHLLPR